MQRDLYKNGSSLLNVGSASRPQALSEWVGENPGNEVNAIFPRINDEFSLSFLLIVANTFRFSAYL